MRGLGITDASACELMYLGLKHFRMPYWAKFSPGIVLIRWLSLGPTRREAERRVSESILSAGAN